MHTQFFVEDITWET